MRFSADEIRQAAEIARPVLDRMSSMPEKDIENILHGKDEVLARFQPIFSPEHVINITEEEYRSFLIFENNKHWKALQRMGPYHIKNMNLLRNALSILVDEGRPIQDRLSKLLPRDEAMVPRFGTATITPILHISNPDKYGVLNKPTEAGLKKLGVWPEFPRDIPFAKKYIAVNQILNVLAEELGVDLWTLDGLWWAFTLEDRLGMGGVDSASVTDEVAIPLSSIGFGLESHLHEFIRDNWEYIQELDEWDLFVEDGDLRGYKYNTGEVGEIDLLAKHKTSPTWLVIELKRWQSSDATLGQIQRYMGWVRGNLAEESEDVVGWIIAQSGDACNAVVLLDTIRGCLREGLPA